MSVDSCVEGFGSDDCDDSRCSDDCVDVMRVSLSRSTLSVNGVNGSGRGDGL